MSTEHQQYSTANQSDAIKEYAKSRGIEVVRTYADEGKSGLQISGRAALQQLIEDVQSGAADFATVLVYDISRWGRFQDADESAYYEHVCKRAGISVHYCAEQFENDGSPLSAIIKSVKRAMAGEYSRELSVKVFAGQRRLVELGYRQGASAGYGLRRMLVDQDGSPKGCLQAGEQKSIKTDRVVLVPGDEEEVATVREIYRAYISQPVTQTGLARLLTAAGSHCKGRKWSRDRINAILTNPKYMGDNVWNRTSSRLGAYRGINPSESWVCATSVFSPVVDRETFYAAQRAIQERAQSQSAELMLEQLRRFYQKHGRVSGPLIDAEDDLPCSETYRDRFGSVMKACLLASGGSHPSSSSDAGQGLRRSRFEAIRTLRQKLNERGVETLARRGSLLIGGELLLSVCIGYTGRPSQAKKHWRIQLANAANAHLVLLLRARSEDSSIQDYYLLPRCELPSACIRISDHPQFAIQAYRVADLEVVATLLDRASTEVAPEQ